MDALLERAVQRAHPSSTGWWRGDCPYCEDKLGTPGDKGNFAVNADSGAWMCWRCDERGRDRGIPELLGSGKRQAQAARQVLRDEAVQPPEGFISLADPSARAARSLAVVFEYLGERNLRARTITEADIGYVPFGACQQRMWYDRIVVPVRDPQTGVWRGYVGRDRVGSQLRPKYMYPSGMKRGELLFNEAALYIETSEPVIVVEGVFDALPHWPRAVACLGKPTQDQRAMLRKARRPIAVALDRDALHESWALAATLRLDGVRATRVLLPNVYKDPGEMPPAELRQLAHEALQPARASGATP